MAVLASLASLLSLAFVGLAPAPAGASTQVVASWTGTLSCSGWATHAVPSDAINVQFTLTGGGGAAGDWDASSARPGGAGGKGSVVTGTLPNAAGTTLQARIGCGGTQTNSAANGYTAGGVPDIPFLGQAVAGGGGGSSALCTGPGANCSGGTVLAIAGGGGGGGQAPNVNGFSGGAGGDAGNGTPATVNTGDARSGAAGASGTGASAGAGGAASNFNVPDNNAPVVAPGTGKGQDGPGGTRKGGSGGAGLRGGSAGASSTNANSGGGGGGAGQSWTKTTSVAGQNFGSAGGTQSSCDADLVGTAQAGYGGTTAANGTVGCAGAVVVTYTLPSYNSSVVGGTAVCTGWTPYVVPAGALSADVTATGGGGGGGENGDAAAGAGFGGAGGVGGRVTGTFSVTPGTTLYVKTGCGGGAGGQNVKNAVGGGGYTTGGNGNSWTSFANQGGAGGGSTAVCRGAVDCGAGATVLLVASGGGGGGGREVCTANNNNTAGVGGSGSSGTADAAGSGGRVKNGSAGTVGAGNSAAVGGAGGAGTTAVGAGGAGASNGTGGAGGPGVAGAGGGGGLNTNTGTHNVGGGGGGAGLFGAGGGGGGFCSASAEASGGGGGGGSSWVNQGQLVTSAGYTFSSATGTAANCGLSNDPCTTGGTGQGGTAQSTGASGSVSITFKLGAAGVAVSGTQSGTASTTASVGPFTLTVKDGAGGTVDAATAITVNLTSSSSGTHGFSATSGGAFGSSVTIPAGSSSTTFYYGDSKAGTWSLTASSTSPSYTVSGSGSATINPATANKLAFSVQPGGADSGSPLAPQPSVQIQDSFGNLTTSTADIGLAIGTDAGGTLSGCSGSTDSGTKAFSGCTITGTPGTYTLVATSTGLTPATSNDITITVAPGVRGRVVKDAGGAGAAGITVRLWSSPAGFSPTYFATTDADGYYALPTGVPAGTWKVIFTDPTETLVTEWYNDSLLRSTSTDIVRTSSTESNTVNASLAAGAVINGTITPDTAITVRLYNQNPVGASPYRQVNFPSGTFQFKALPAGIYYIAITDQAGVNSERWYNGQTLRQNATPITIATGATSTLTPQSFFAAPTVTGTIKNSSNVPLADITVSAYNASTGVLVKSVKTDASGNYELTSLPASVKIYVKDTAKQYSPQWVGGTTLANAAVQAVPSTVNITMLAPGLVSGIVTVDGTGVPIEGAKVWLYLDGGALASTFTDSSGAYYFLNLTPSTGYTTQYIATGFKTEYNANKSSKATADLFAVTEATDSAINAALLPS